MSEETVVKSFEGPVHVSFKSVKNTVPPARYKLQVAGYDFVTASTGTPGVRVKLAFDPNMHPEYAKRSQTERFWFTPEAINLYLSFIVACGIDPELLREVPVDPPQTNEDGSPVTHCAYSVDDQLKAVYASSVYADLIEEQYDGKAADGVTPEKKWTNRVATRGFTKA